MENDRDKMNDKDIENIVSLCEAIRQIKEDTILRDKEIVFILGAGASVESGVPLARDLRKALMKGYQDLMETMLETKIGIKNINDATLEMIVSLYNELCQDERAGYRYLEKKCPDIQKAYTRTIPFIYEVIAHMFYFRIIRNIISLNFDELLERALDDEVGGDDYEKVRSPAAFERTMVYQGDARRLKRMRFLLKPHGTIGNRVTMRHSWEEVTRLDKEAHQVISKIMDRTAILVTIGYSFMDRDLRGLFLSPFLADNAPDYKELYIIDSENSSIEDRHPFNELKGHKNIKFIKTGAEKFSNVFAKTLFSGPWNENYCGIQKHRARYLLNRRLFDLESSLHKEPTSSPAKVPYSIYFRLLIEIMLFILSVKGKFRGDVLLESARVARYFRTLQGFFDRGANSKISPRYFSIRKALQIYAPAFVNGAMADNKLGEETYYCKGPDITYRGDADTYLVEKLLQCLASHLIERRFSFQNHEVDFANDEELKGCLKEIINLFDISLIEKANKLIAFENPYIICRYRDFFDKTADIIKPWNGLLISAETGEWIKRAIEKKEDEQKKKDPNYAFNAGSVAVIINDYGDEPADSYHRSRVQEIVKFLRAHKISVRINIQKENPHHFNINLNPPQRAIYFYRYGRSISICPILLKDEDVEPLLQIFKQLWDNADNPVDI